MTWVRIVAPVAINQLAFSLLANSFWLYAAGYGGGGSYGATVAVRLVQTAVLIPVQVVVVPILLRIVLILRRQRLVG
jgi:hypothetical protein